MRFRRRRGQLLASWDVAAWLVSYVAMAVAARLAYPTTSFALGASVLAGLTAGFIFVAIGWVIKLHRGRAAVGSFEEVLIIVPLALVVGALVAGLDYAFTTLHVTRTFAAPWMAVLLMLWGRGLYRVVRERSHGIVAASGSREPVIVVGAGNAARQLVSALLSDPKSPWHPIALLDDDPMKRYRRLRGIPVVGGLHDLGNMAKSLSVTTAILAIPSAGPDLVRHMTSLATKSGITLKALPAPFELREPGRVAIGDVRDINLSDLLGRRQIDTDLPAVAGYLAGKRVLVTGAGGSIGSELCRQVAQFNPRELIMLDRDESALHSVELSIYGHGLLDNENTVLGDIRDAQFVRDLFDQRRPEVVFHAAALKHLPLLEKAPGEAIKTNIWGSLAVLDAAAKSGVGRFVNISTDKAANPTSVLGYSKRLAEGLTAAVSQEADGVFLSVRFGNVLGSRGSVLTSFAAQIAAGGPVTVTDPGVTRYFMTLQEAVQLVIQAGAIGRPGEVLVLDMGEPVSIDSVARQLIDLSGGGIEITYTGLRGGEKMHEDLFGEGEIDVRPEHDLISHAEVPVFDRSDAVALDPWCEVGVIRKALLNACKNMQAANMQAVEV